jgi:hypothetical protein
MVRSLRALSLALAVAAALLAGCGSEAESARGHYAAGADQHRAGATAHAGSLDKSSAR